MVELDSRCQQLELVEERARLVALAPQITKISSEIAQENQALAETRKARQISLQQAQTRMISTAQSAVIAADIAERFHRLGRTNPQRSRRHKFQG